MTKPNARITDVLPLSPLQSGMLFHSMVGAGGAREDGGHGGGDGSVDAADAAPPHAGPGVFAGADEGAYTVQAVLGLRGGLDRELLQRSVAALVERHANLRVAFRQSAGGETVQVVLDGLRVPLRFVDAVGRRDAADVVAQVARAERARPFDLARRPAIRFALVQTASDAFSVVVTNHHILMDGWSLPVLLRELFAVYAAGGSTAGLPPVTPFKAYLDWLARQDDERSLARWGEVLGAGVEPSLVARPGDHGGPGAAHGTSTLVLTRELTAALTARCRGLAVTTNTAVQTAWALVVAQLTGQQDVVVGATVSGRPADLPGVEDMVGLFINTVPVRVPLPTALPLGEALRGLQSQQSSLLEHQHVPLPRLHSLTGCPQLFDTLTVFENYPLDAAVTALPGTGLEIVSIDSTDRTHYPLTLVALPGESLTLRLDHRHDVADDDEAQRLLARLQAVLTAIVERPETPLGALEVLAPGEREQLLALGHGTAPHGPGGLRTLDGMVRAVADSHPTRPALSHAGTEHDYAALDAAADRVAATLAADGVTPGDVVALLMPRSVDLVVCVLGVQRAGAAYLPVDPSYPAQRIAFMLEDAAPALVLTDGTGPEEDHDDTAGPRRRALTGILGDVAVGTSPAGPRTAATAPVSPGPHDPAYVIYTSGSTGQPKGVVVTHAGVGAFAQTCAERFFVEPTSRVLQFSSPSFDAFVLELCSAFGSGATLVVPDETPLVGPTLDRVLRGGRVSHALIPPAALATLEHTDLPDLDVLVVGGDATPASLVEAWAPGRRMVNAYGPTEATIVASTGSPMTRGEQTRVIGTPVTGTDLLVLDHAMRLCPVGTAGELFIGGDGLARGYLGRPDLTAERFVADPSGEPGSRLYRTGDLVRWGRDGGLEFLGRSDRQVKLRGFRIELREIESVLLRHPSVRQCVVVVRTDEGGRPTLAAYVVAAEGQAPAHRELRRFVSDELPEHMVPATTTVLAALPTTANGSKVDVAALPAPAAAAPVHADRPTGQVGALADLFAQVLGLEQVAADDSFFELGGDSILSIQLVSRARAAGFVISPKQVFELRTPERLANAVATAPSAAGVVRPARPEDALGDCPTTPVMEWLREQGGPAGAVDSFHQSLLVQTPVGIDAAWVRSAIATLLERPEALRARLVRAGDSWSLHVPEHGEDVDDVVTAVSATHLDDADLDTLVAQHAEGAAAALAPEAGHMVRAVWFDRGEQRGRLLVLAHHLVVDGVSWRIVCEDLAALHAGASHLPPTGTSWRQWALDLRAEAVDESRVAELDHWVSETEPVSRLGARPLDPGCDTVAAVRHSRTSLGVATTSATLTTVPACVRGDVTDVLLAALTLAVARWREARSVPVDDLLVDLERHGREPLLAPTDVTRTVGWFTSVQPVRLAAPDAGRTGLDLLSHTLKSVKEHLRSVPGDGLGHGLLRHLNPHTAPRLAGRRSEVGFNYLGRFAAQQRDWAAVSGENVLGGGVDSRMPVPHALEVTAVTRDGDDGPVLELALAHPDGMFADGAVAALLDDWVAVLDDFASAVDHDGLGGRTPSDVTLLPGLTQVDVDALDRALGADSELMPLTPMQQGLLFHADLDTDDVYRVQVAIELEGPLDGTRLRDAVEQTVAHHVGLGQGFWRDGPDGPLAFRPARTAVPWREIDLTGPAEVGGSGLADLRASEAGAPFDLARPPLVRAVLAQTGPRRHVLVVTMHHLLADGWSMPLVVKEVFARYGEAPVAPAGDLRDYLSWATGLDRPAHLEAWRERLAGVDTATRAADVRLGDDMGVDEHVELLTAESTRLLHETARARGVTVNSMVQSAWALVLAGLSGRTDVVFGATTSGRPAELDGVESTVGLFINTLPVRVRLRAEESLGDLVARVQAEQAAMLDHQYVPLASVQEAAGAGELFDTLTVFENYPLDAAGLQLPGTGLTVGDVAVQDATHYPLTVVALPGERLQVAVKFRTAAFTPHQAREVATAVVAVLGHIMERPAALVGAVETLSPAGRAQALAVTAGAPLHRLPDTDLVSAFARQAQSTPDRVALVGDDGGLTYRELDEASNRLANLLVEAGVGPDDPVALLQQRSAGLVVSTLAVLKAGGCYLPLDARSPGTRLHDVVVESGARVLLLDDASAPALPALPAGTCEVITLDGEELDPRLARQPATAPRTLVLSTSCAYVMFTSGSTGRPKGVAVTHANVLDLVADGAWNDNHERVLVHSPHAFDASTFEVWVPLLTGRQLVLAPPGELSLADLARVVREREVTGLWLTAGLFRLLAEEDPGCFASVREVWSGGDVVPASVVRAVLTANPGLVFADGYGPTETTTFATYHRIADPAAVETLVPIGRPLDGMRTHVLDPFLQPVPTGAPGELYIAGAGVSRGYLNRPELTAERFVPDPFGEPGSVMYRSGDVVRWSHDHGAAGPMAEPVLEFVGRSDEQIKIRGFRIELGEIEAACSAQPGVGQATVVVVEVAPGDKRLAAYLVAEGGTALDPARVRAALATALPEYMMPASVKVIPALPLTPNGKVDRRALPAPELGRAGGGRPPRNAREAQLCALFGTVLGVESVGIDDSFFDLGGHSLLATRLVSRIRSTLGAEVSVRTLFEHPTVADLVGRLGESAERPRPRALAERGAESPAAFGQRRLWFLNELDPEHSPYKIPVLLSLTGRLRRDALAAALRDVVERHEVLRTVYRQHEGEVVQVVLPMNEVDLDVEHEDVRVVGAAPSSPEQSVEDAVELAVQDAVARRIALPFDLARDVPLRVTVLRTGEERHRLLMVMHHIAADGWSMAPLARDFSVAYAARCRGEEPVREPLPLQYADYARWQRELAGSDDSGLAAQLDHWKDALADLPEELTLPTDRPRPNRPESNGAALDFELPAGLYEPLRELAQRSAASPFMVLQAAIAALLSKLGAGHDIPVGSPIAGRTDERLDDLVGFFVNTLVLRTDTSGDPTFAQLLARVRETVLTAYANQDVPFDRLVEELRPTRVTGRTPLFQVMLVVQNNAATELALPGLDVAVTPAGVHASQFDLSFDLTEAQGDDGSTRAVGRLDYSSDLFDEVTARSLVERLVRLLTVVVARPDLPLGGVDLLDDAERTLVLNTWNETSRDDQLADVVESVRSFAQLTPGAPALTDDTGARLTYGQLAARAGWLTRRLVASAVQPGEVVAVLMERGVHVPTALVGILGADAAYTPLDVDSPPARLVTLLRDSAARFVVTTPENEHRAHAAADACDQPVEVVVLQGQVDDEPVACRAHAQDLAYVLFTSGSTGRPKGAMIHRAGMHNHLMAKVEDLRLSSVDTVVQNAPLSFDVSVWQMLTALLVGGTTHVVGRDRAMDPTALVAEVVEHGATVLEVVPSMLRTLLDEWDETEATPPLDRLRTVMVTGETLPAALCRRWFARFPGIPLVNAYGPTECSDDVTHAHLCADSDLRSARVPIGRAVRNTRLYVLDELLQPVPVGVIGELCVGGTGVGHGYLGDPVKTALAFVPDPFGAEPGARLYRTGDQVRYTRDGQLEFLGRVDHQVKIRGQRIELSEIESVMHGIDGVRDALVVVRPGPAGEKSLVAYAVTRADEQWIRQELSLLLPDAMVPAVVVTLDAFPLTRNGKVDRAALPEPDFARLAGGRLPSTGTEFLLADVFSDVLGVPAVGVDENFFALGGHSLLATKVLGRVRTLFDRHLPVRTIFDAPTVAALAAVVDAGARTDLALTPRTRPERIPLSAVQRRLWFLSTMDPGAAYNVPMALRLRGDLDVAALTTALHDVVRRHESLRTIYPQHDGVPHQLVVGEDLVRLPLPVHDVAQDDLHDRIAAGARDGFDLERDLPLRAHLLRTGPEEHVLVLVLHHIACDGGSLGPLTHDLGAAYAARAAGSAPAWEPLPVQYADFSLWQHEVLSRPATPSTLAMPSTPATSLGDAADGSGGAPAPTVEQAQVAFWRDALAGIPDRLDLPTDRPRPAESDFRALTVPVELDHELHHRLEQLARAHDVSLAMLLQAGVVAVLRRLGAGGDVPIALPVSGRHHEQLAPLVGFFVNTLVIRHELDAGLTFDALLAQVRERNLAAFSNQDVPFERLVEVLNPPRSLTTHPLAQVAFSYQPAETPTVGIDGLAVDLLPLTAATAKFDLSVKLAESRTEDGHAAGVSGVLEFRADLFDTSTVERLAERLLRVLRHVAAHDERDDDERQPGRGAREQAGLLVDDLPALSDTERDLVLSRWSAGPDTAHASGSDEPPAPWWRLVERQAERTPDAPAVLDGLRTLTYAELDRRSNAVARDLAGAGVGPEAYVGLALPRSAELFVGLLAVAKTGAAYLPIETTYPRERITLLLETVAPATVLTTAASIGCLPAVLPGGVSPTLVDADADPGPDADTRPLADAERTAAPQLRHPAYAIFTSGSTGLPKGVVVDHFALADYVRFAGRDYPGLAGTTLLHSSVSFDLSVSGMIVPLTVGGAVRVATLQEHDAATSTALAQDPATFLKATPSHLPLLDALPEHYAPTGELLLGGELLTGAVVDAWRRRHPGVTVLNMYGPTETTVNCTQLRISPGDVLDPGPLPIGRPLDGHRALVLDDRLQPVPPGVAGELYVAGNGLARGYFDQPALTASRFVPNPWGAPGERMYRTGDVVRWDAQGRLVFLHRVDDQVKIRGFRVELGETQAALRLHPAVGRSAVTVHRAPTGDRLVGYVVLADGVTATPAVLRDHVASRLPGHLVPDVVVVVDDLPLTPNGKVDWRALPAPHAPDAGGLAPRDLLEVRIAEAFAEVLELPRVGVEQSFFDLGGHSLLASRLLARLRATLDVDLTIRTLFEAPSVAELASRVRAGGVGGSAFDEVLPLRPHGSARPLWCIHPASGFSWSYAGLGRHLGPDVPVYGLQAPGLNGERPPLGDVGALAAHYVHALRAVQPEGPYRLLGWSFGGIVAHEMAAMLEADGERVELLALLDAFPKTQAERVAGTAPARRELFAALLELAGYDATALHAPPDRTTRHGADGGSESADGSGGDPADLAATALSAQGGVLGDVTRRQLEGIYDVFTTNTALARRHVPRPVAAPTLLFVATRDETGGRSEQRWHPYLLGDLRRVDVDSRHNDMTSPSACEAIGGELAPRLRETTDRPSPPAPATAPAHPVGTTPTDRSTSTPTT